MRDGNSNGLVVVRDCKSVYRLPMRDGNFGNPFETRIRIRVYRLPMRDGNCNNLHAMAADRAGFIDYL